MTSLEWLDSLQGSGIRPGLARMRKLLRPLGNPHRRVPAVLIAGTNGKGSTSATLASILEASGYRAGLYTSPHLVDIRERWQIAGEPIGAELLDRSIAELRAAAERIGMEPTYFEALTLVAFIAFARAGCEMSVLEVGMGGRLDATNVVAPLASLITPVGFDHMEFLGTTLRQIAFEKAGIIHRGSIVLTSNRDPVVLEVLRRRAAKFDREVIVVDPPATAVATPLAGEFQQQNVALAVRAARELNPLLPRVTEESIDRGVRATQWRGRLEQIVAGGKSIWIDGCHNPHAVAAVRPFIETSIAAPRLLVFGVMGDKDVDVIARGLVPLFDRVITTEPYPPRSEPAEALAARVRALGVAAEAEPDPRRAFEKALAAAEPSIFVGGSLYLAGAAIAFFA